MFDDQILGFFEDTTGLSQDQALPEAHFDDEPHFRFEHPDKPELELAIFPENDDCQVLIAMTQRGDDEEIPLWDLRVHVDLDTEQFVCYAIEQDANLPDALRPFFMSGARSFLPNGYTYWDAIQAMFEAWLNYGIDHADDLDDEE